MVKYQEMKSTRARKIPNMKTVEAYTNVVVPKSSTTEPPAAPRGAEVLVRALIKNGVDTIFGLPGGAVLHIYDEIWRYRHEVTHYLVRHEQGAVHAAEGYAKATGKVGVALVTSGPGATNAVTGIADAFMDSVPLVVITGGGLGLVGAGGANNPKTKAALVFVDCLAHQEII